MQLQHLNYIRYIINNKSNIIISNENSIFYVLFIITKRFNIFSLFKFDYV